MRRLAFALALCAVMVASTAVPAAAVPIDPGRLVVQTPAMTSTHSATAPAGTLDRLTLIVHSPSELGDRPADGTQDTRLVMQSDLGSVDSFNLAAIGAGSG